MLIHTARSFQPIIPAASNGQKILHSIPWLLDLRFIDNQALSAYGLPFEDGDSGDLRSTDNLLYTYVRGRGLVARKFPVAFQISIDTHVSP